MSIPERLEDLVALVSGEPVSFMAMKSRTSLSDGNLHVQTRKLADAGYISVEKVRKGRRAVTEFRITEQGLERFRLYVRKLQQVLDQSASSPEPARPSHRRDDSAVWS